jgi:hypothetical protein
MEEILKQPVDGTAAYIEDKRGRKLYFPDPATGKLTTPVAAAVTGNVTGNLTGNVTGNVTGNLTGTASLATQAEAVIGHLTDPGFVTPVNAIAAPGIITYQNATDATAGKIVTIGTKPYKFVAGPVAAEGDVLIGANADATFLNLERAINKSGGTPDTDYKVALAHPDVAATQTAGSDIVTLAARVKGTAANSIALTTDEATITLSGATMGAGAGVDGVDGTVGAKGDLRFDESYIYLCTAANTVAGSNWKRLGGHTLEGF